MAYEFYVKAKGTKQGQFKGESPRKGWTECIPGLEYEYALQSPRDLATGQASGKRQHSPVTFVKEWGASSPQFLQACATNEVLPQVEFSFLKTDPSGKETVYFVVKLTNATVSKIEQYTEESAKHEDAADTHELEEISLTFQKIEWEDKLGKTAAQDDWHA